MAHDENATRLPPIADSTNLQSSQQFLGSVMTPGITPTTALAQRTADDVFADLRRPLHLQPSQMRSQDEKGDRIAINPVEDTSVVDRSERDHEANLLLEDEDENEDKTNQLVPEVKRLSARKQRHNAIFDSFLLEASKKLKGEKISSAEDDAKQSIRWLIDQSEKQQIISSPRDYQIELFERAKEKNTIAVLDTGRSSIISAIFS